MKSNVIALQPQAAPRSVIHTTPRRLPNAAMRTREYLTEEEVARIMAQARRNRYGERDAAMVLTAFRHGLRAAELCDLRWDQVDFKAADLHVRRIKRGKPAVHPIEGDELRALRALRRSAESRFIFVSMRGAPFTPSGFAALIARLGHAAGFGFKLHPHMLRHACGFALANRGIDTRTIQDWLGHKCISNTARYTALAPGRFRQLNMWSK